MLVHRLLNRLRGSGAYHFNQARRLARRHRAETGEPAPFLFDAPFVKLRPEKVSGCEIVADRYEMLTRFPKGGVVAEVGTQTGKYARCIIDTCKPDKLDVLDVRFDLFQDDLLRDELDCGRVEKVQGYSEETMAKYQDEFFDWIYVDAAHGYEAVVKDLALAARKVKAKGFIVANDYTNFSPHDLEPYGVLTAVNELCNASDWKMRYFALNDVGFHDVVLTRPGGVLG